MLYCPGGDVAHIAACLAGNLQSPFILSETVCFAQVCHIGSTLTVGILEGVDLLEEVEVPFIATLEGLISLFCAKNLNGTLGGIRMLI